MRVSVVTGLLLCAIFLTGNVLAQRGNLRGGGGLGGGARGGHSGGGFGGVSKPAAGAWGGGSVVHRDISRPNRPNLPERGEIARPGLSDQRERERPNLSDRSEIKRPHLPNHVEPSRPNTPDRHEIERPTRPGRPGSGGLDPHDTAKMLKDRGFNSSAELRRALDEKGLHGPRDVQKTLNDHAGKSKEMLRQKLSEKGMDPAKIDRSRINASVKNRVDRIDHNTVANINKNFKNTVAHRRPTGHHGYFSPDWYHHHPGSWCPPRPIPPHHWWRPGPPWNHACRWFTAGFITGAVANTVLTPIPYYYGTNVYYVGEMVYVNGVPYVSAEEYYDQACELADSGDTIGTINNITINTTAADSKDSTSLASSPGQTDSQEEWLPMGTFAVLKDPDDKNCERVLQLATSKSGRIAGNLYDVNSDKTIAVTGAVDPKTQRVAFHAPGHEEVGECGLWNLTQDSLTLLLHIDKDKTEERTLVRLTDSESEQPPGPANEAKTPASPQELAP